MSKPQQDSSEQMQEVQVRMQVSLTVPARLTTDEVRRLVQRGLNGMFPAYHRHYHRTQFAEEADIYQTPNSRTRWHEVFQPMAGGTDCGLTLTEALEALRRPLSVTAADWPAGMSLTDACRKVEKQRLQMWQHVMDTLGGSLPSVWETMPGEVARCVFVGTSQEVAEFMAGLTPREGAKLEIRHKGTN